MFKQILVFVILFGLGVVTSNAQMRSITHTTTATNDLTVTIETNTQYIIYSAAVSFANVATGTVTIAHVRGSYIVNPLMSMSLTNLSSSTAFLVAPYIVDGKQGDTLTLSTTNCAKAGKIFLNIHY